ncbi:MAG: hypothetical protein ACLPX9_04885 [Rhodomicrobium sp.]
MKVLFSALLLGSAIAFTASVASAQEPQTTTQNPFGQGAQPASPAAKTAKKTRGAPALTSGQFANEAEAKANCPGDSVVWANLGTKVFHHTGSAAYGTTKRGAYMCEKDTAAAGFRAAKNEKHK